MKFQKRDIDSISYLFAEDNVCRCRLFGWDSISSTVLELLHGLIELLVSYAALSALGGLSDLRNSYLVSQMFDIIALIESCN